MELGMHDGDRIRARDLAIVGITALALGLALSLPLSLGAKASGGGSADPILDISDESGGIAATVNGEVIGENAVTAYIENFREVQGLGGEDDWGRWLIDAGYTVDSLRGETLEYYEGRELVKQAAEERGIAVSEGEVSEAIGRQREAFDSDEAWEEALKGSRMSEERLRADTEASLLQEALSERIAEESPVTDEDALDAVRTYASVYEGSRRSSHILFEDGEGQLAREVLGKIESGELDFEEAAARYSKDEASAGKGGDVGWDKSTQFVEGYQTALDGLSVGEITGPVETEFGIHLIMCTDFLDLPDEVASLDQVSQGFADYIREMLEKSNGQMAFNEFMIAYKKAADIQENAMPEGLSYVIDLTPYEEEARASMQESAGGGDAPNGDDSPLDE